MSDALMKSIRESEIGNARCVNCNSKWLSHGGIRCMIGRAAEGDGTYRPIGFNPYAIIYILFYIY